MNAATTEVSGSGIDASRKFQALAQSPGAHAQISEFRVAIFETMGDDVRTTLSELRLDLPSNPPLSEDAEQCKILMGSGPDYTTLRSVFPSDDWVASYGDNKWAGHVFYTPEDSKRRKAGEAASEVLSAIAGVTFKPSALDNCFK